jgi:hypothetical protein
MLWSGKIFDSLQPFWVKWMKKWNVCCCIRHVELEELWVVLNNIWLNSGIHSKTHCASSCEDVCPPETTKTNICTSSHVTYLGLIAHWGPQDEFSKWHSKECLFYECENCGVDTFLICPIWHTPNSLRDSNVSPKLKTMKEQGVGARSLVRSTIEG